MHVCVYIYASMDIYTYYSIAHLKHTHTYDNNKHIFFVKTGFFESPKNRIFRITGRTPLFLSTHHLQSSSATCSVSDSPLHKSPSYMHQGHTSLILTYFQHTRVILTCSKHSSVFSSSNPQCNSEQRMQRRQV